MTRQAVSIVSVLFPVVAAMGVEVIVVLVSIAIRLPLTRQADLIISVIFSMVAATMVVQVIVEPISTSIKEKSELNTALLTQLSYG